MLVGMDGWSLGRCANCDKPLDPGEHPSLFCCKFCKGYAKDVRYFRACARDGRMADPEVREALTTRMAFIIAGGYNAEARHLEPAVRVAVLAANHGLCCTCNEAPATEVDHINGPSGLPENLQGLCDPCHNMKTAQSFQPMTADDKVIRDAFLTRVRRQTPLRPSDDDVAWKTSWRQLLAATRQWCEPAEDPFESGYFGDGSTGMVDDYEHGIYLQMLADRDD